MQFAVYNNAVYNNENITRLYAPVIPTLLHISVFHTPTTLNKYFFKTFLVKIEANLTFKYSASNQCEECGQHFASRGKLMQHKLKLRYFCCHCSKNFASVVSLKQHQDCLDMTMHICPFCKMFRNVGPLLTFYCFGRLDMCDFMNTDLYH